MNARGASSFLYAGVLLVSAVALGLEILLTRIMALMLWHHFTYVVIGVALLGFGGAGSYIMVRRARGESEADRNDSVSRRLSRHSLALAASIPLAYAMVTRVRIAPLSLGEDPNSLVGLLMIYLLIAFPFFFAGLVICDAIETAGRRVGTVYFWDLLGAGLGAVAAVTGIELLTAPGMVMVFGALAAVGALCFALGAAGDAAEPESAAAPRRWLLWHVSAAVGLGAVLLVVVLPYARSGSLDPPLAPGKELTGLSRVVPIETTLWNPLARIDVSQAVDAVPEMGGTFPPDTPQHNVRGVFQDGSAPTLLLAAAEEEGDLEFLTRASAASGHIALRARGNSDVEQMAIGVGGGVDLLIALEFGVKKVTGVEINASTISLLEERYADYTGRITERDDVELVHAEGRHFARASGREFDLIQLSGVDTYTALNSGAYALSESYLYTLEGVQDFLDALRPEGVLSYTRFVFEDRPRETLRLAATAVVALESQGVTEPWDHVFVSTGRSWASLILSKTAFEPAVLDALRSLCADNAYSVVYDPENPQENAFDACIRLAPEEREAFYEEYPFEIRPAVDDQPFFFNYFKWSGLFEPAEYGGHAYRLVYPVGHFCLILSLIQTLILGAFFILRPLRHVKAIGFGGTSLAALGYFSALGIGFIAVEVVLMQRFVLFLGHPTWSLTTVLPTILIAAGFGSLTVRPETDALERLRKLMLWIPLVIGLGWLVAGFTLDALLGLSHGLRIGVSVALLFPIGFVLGQAFPVGVRIITAERPGLVPWVWAVNAFTTVLGSTGTVLLAMEVGFAALMIAMIPVYLLGILALRRGFGVRPQPG